MDMRRLFRYLYLPLLGLTIGFLYAFALNTGITETWLCIGKPSSKISKIIGFVEKKLFLNTENGNVYSIAYEEYIIVGRKNSIPLPAQWVKEDVVDIIPDPIRRFYDGFIALPPLFEIKQEYSMEFQEIEGSSLVKFVISNDGNLWMWNFGIGVYHVFLYCITPLLGFLAGGILTLIIMLGLFVTKKTRKFRTH